MHEQLTWFEPCYFICWHPGVGATNPQVFRLLDGYKLLEEVRLLAHHVVRPDFVVLQYQIEAADLLVGLSGFQVLFELLHTIQIIL